MGSTILDPDRGLRQGFQEYDRITRDTAEPLLTVRRAVQRRAAAVIDDAIRWLAGVGDSAFFLWTHLYDPHRPYQAPEPFASRYDPYIAELVYADSQIARLLDALQQRDLLERVIVVVTADHGESLGEHREMDHDLPLRERVSRAADRSCARSHTGARRRPRPAHRRDAHDSRSAAPSAAGTRRHQSRRHDARSRRTRARGLRRIALSREARLGAGCSRCAAAASNSSTHRGQSCTIFSSIRSRSGISSGSARTSSRRCRRARARRRSVNRQPLRRTGLTTNCARAWRRWGTSLAARRRRGPASSCQIRKTAPACSNRAAASRTPTSDLWTHPGDIRIHCMTVRAEAGQQPRR